LLWFDKNRLIINKDKSLALGFHHKSNKHIAFPDLILKDGQVTYLSPPPQKKKIFFVVWLDRNLN